MKNIIIILGPPCVGKGSISALLSKKINYQHLSIGELLRFTYPIGHEVRTWIDNGNMADNKIIIDLLKMNHGKKIILDGFPRIIEQVAILESLKEDIEAVFIIDAETDVLIERMHNRQVCSKCEKSNIHNNCDGKMIKRTDDNIEIYTKRLFLYNNNINEIIKKMNNLHIEFINNNKEQTLNAIVFEIIHKLKYNI